MTQTFEQIDPTTVEVGPNVRLDPKMDKKFIASVRERGVLEPVLLYRAENGTVTVLAGQRRALAARETGQPLPAVISDQPPTEADRLVDQYVENEHRAALSNSERITAIEQMALAGLSDHQIAKRTATPKATVQAAKAAAQSPALREFADQLTLDQAAVLAEFDDDPEAVEVLLTAAQQGRFEHTAQRIRNDRAEQAKRAEFAATLTAQGITVVDRPGHTTSRASAGRSRCTGSPTTRASGSPSRTTPPAPATPPTSAPSGDRSRTPPTTPRFSHHRRRRRRGERGLPGRRRRGGPGADLAAAGPGRPAPTPTPGGTRTAKPC